MTPDVGELVREDRFDLVRREAGQRARRQQHDRLQPADHGRHSTRSSTRASRTARPMCRRRIRRSRRSLQASGAGRAPCDFIRCTHIQPLNSRSVNSATPASQTDTNIGSHSIDGPGVDGASARAAGMACMPVCDATAGRDWRAGLQRRRRSTPGRRSPPVSSHDAGRLRPSVCTAVTTGIVSISASAIVDDHVADVGGRCGAAPPAGRPSAARSARPARRTAAGPIRSPEPTGCRSISSIAVISVLPACFDQSANLAELLGGRPLGVERLHHQLRRGSAEGAFEQVAHQLALRLLLAEAWRDRRGCDRSRRDGRDPSPS